MARKVLPMTEEHKEVLKKNHILLCRDMDVETMLRYCYQEGILYEYMLEDIMALPTSSQRNEKLLMEIKRRGDKAFHILLEGLEKEAKQHHLVVALKKTDDILQVKEERTINIAMSSEQATHSGQKHTSTDRIEMAKELSEPAYPAADIGKIRDVFQRFKPNIRSKWRRFAKELGLSKMRISKIEKLYPKAHHSKCAELVLEAWLEKTANISEETLLGHLYKLNIPACSKEETTRDNGKENRRASIRPPSKARNHLTHNVIPMTHSNFYEAIAAPLMDSMIRQGRPATVIIEKLKEAKEVMTDRIIQGREHIEKDSHRR